MELILDALESGGIHEVIANATPLPDTNLYITLVFSLYILLLLLLLFVLLLAQFVKSEPLIFQNRGGWLI